MLVVGAASQSQKPEARQNTEQPEQDISSASDNNLEEVKVQAENSSSSAETTVGIEGRKNLKKFQTPPVLGDIGCLESETQREKNQTDDKMFHLSDKIAGEIKKEATNLNVIDS